MIIDRNEFPKIRLNDNGINGGFGKLLDDNRQKWGFQKSGSTIMEFSRGFGKLLSNNGWKRSFPKSGLMITEFNGGFIKQLYNN